MSAWRDGMRAAMLNARLLWWLLGANLALALLATAPLMRPIEESLAHHEAAAEMAHRFDISWWIDVTTSRADAFAAALDGMAAAALLSTLAGCFFAGGLLQAYHDSLSRLPMDRFMTSCRRWFPAFVRLFALSLPLYWLVHRLVNGSLAIGLDGAFELVNDERTALLIGLARSALFLVMFDLITLIFDYARVHAVLRSDRSMLSCLSTGARFVLLHPGRVAALEASAFALQCLALGIFVPLDALVLDRGGTVAGLVLALVASQSFLLMRLFLREGARASQVACYRDCLTDSR